MLFILFTFVSQAVVQVETLSEFGAFFILFCVGLEFSPEKIRKVKAVLFVLFIKKILTLNYAALPFIYE